MDSLRDLKLFLRVAETSSFSAVARELSLTQPSVSRAVAQLERSIGTRLLTRTTRLVALTDAGRALYERAGPPARELADAAEEVRAGATKISGTVRLAVPSALGRHLVLPVVTRFLNELPNVNVELALTDRPVDLIEEGVDLAVRVGMPQSATLVTRALGSSVQRLVGSPRYLKGHKSITAVADLAKHQFIARKAGGRVMSDLGAFQMPLESIRLTADDVEAVYDATLAHLGLSILPAWLVDEDVRRKKLIRLLPRLPMPAAKVYVVLPAGRQAPLRVRALIDRLVAAMGAKLEAQ